MNPRPGALNPRNLGLLALALGATAFLLAKSPADDDAVFALPAGKLYLAECGSCHTAYAPGMLPARSWRRLLDGLEDHFGEDATLEEPKRLALIKELETLAEAGGKLRLERLRAAIPAAETPLRISDNPYVRALHDELPESVWRRKGVGSRANCGGCHQHANTGHYAERELRIPGAL
jgi:cytochrome c553